MFQILHTNPFLTCHMKNRDPAKPQLLLQKRQTFQTHVSNQQNFAPQKVKNLVVGQKVRKFIVECSSSQKFQTFLTSFNSSFTLLLLPKREEASSNDDVLIIQRICEEYDDLFFLVCITLAFPSDSLKDPKIPSAFSHRQHSWTLQKNEKKSCLENLQSM